ncbi:MAG: hypothetical protein AAF483_12305 [Planctomycetota bacterium]
MWRLLRAGNASIQGVAILFLAAIASLLYANTDRDSGPERATAAASSTAAGVTSVQATASVPAPPPASSEQLATQIMHQALLQSVWGPPAWCQVKQQLQTHGQRFTGFGKYVRAGEGSGKLNLSIQLSTDSGQNTLLQVADGQRLQTIQALGNERKRSVVDLDEVHDDLKARFSINNRDPQIALYLAIGGQAESIRKLCQQYQWYRVREGKYGGQAVWILNGRLNQNAPAVRALAMVDQKLFSQNLSGLLPTEAQVAVGKADSKSGLPYWLYQVEHRRSASELSALNSATELLLVTQWSNPQVLESEKLTANHFQVTSTNDPWIEETDLYLPPRTR